MEGGRISMVKLRYEMRWWVTVSMIILLLVLVGFALLRLGKNIEAGIIDAKTVRRTTATVTGKVYVRFDEGDHSYAHDNGYKVNRMPGDEEWRVYYRIDNFDQLDEPLRGRLLRLEESRVAEGRRRYTMESKEWYEGIRVDDSLTVLYQLAGDDGIEVVSILEPENPQSR